MNNINVDKLISGVISYHNFLDACQFLKKFGDYSDSSGYVSQLIFHNNTQHRILGFVKYMILAAPGANVRGAYTIGPSLLEWMANNADKAKGLAGFDNYIASVLFNYCQACYGAANFDACLQVIALYQKKLPELINCRDYWHALVFCAKSQFRQLNFEEAHDLLSRVPEAYRDVEQFSIVKDELIKLQTQRFVVEIPIVTEDKILSIWQTTFPKLSKNLDLYEDCLSRSGSTTPQEMALLRDLIDTMVTIANGDMYIEEKMHEIASLRLKFGQLWRGLLQINFQGDFTIARVDNLSEETDIMISSADFTQLLSHRKNLESAIQWTLAVKDAYGNLQLLWCNVLIHLAILSKHGDIEEQKELVCHSIVELLTAINHYKEQIPNYIYKAGITNLFPGVVPKVFSDTNSRFGPKLAFLACESHKGRSLLAIQSEESLCEEVGSKFPQQKMLGEATHYLSFTTSNYTDRIYSTIYCANGTVDATVIDLSVSGLRRLFPNIDPQSWEGSASLFGKPVNLQLKLVPLIVLLDRHLACGNIQAGDHICVAAEDPVYPFPLSYIKLGQGILVEKLSLGYVASFADALRIYQAEPVKPKKSHGVYVSRRGEKQPETKFQRFQSIEKLLGTVYDICDFKDLSNESSSHILRRFTPNSIIHMDTHGYFEHGKNPYSNAGLLVSDGISKPTGSVAPQYLLTPEILVDSKVNMEGSHVTLNACVSGLGKAGQGGDILGLDFALRYKAAASLIASQWHVNGALSDRFLHYFYTGWLVNGLSRAQAWRAATTHLINDKDYSIASERASCCFFSLYGDWR